MTTELMTLIEDCETRSDKLSDWEVSFIDSIKDQLTRSGGLSEKQTERLEAIWDRVT